MGAITWQRRHSSDTGWLAYEGRRIRGQVAMFDETGADHLATGRHYWLGYVTSERSAVTGRCDDPGAALRGVEAALARSS